MKELFHGWRRKAGGIALGLACALTVAWLRSLLMRDKGGLNVWGIILGGTSEFGRVECVLEWPLENDGVHWVYRQTPLGRDISETFMGFSWTNHPLFLIVTVPYWFLVIPLTLLAVRLILQKPSTQMQTKSVG